MQAHFGLSLFGIALGTCLLGCASTPPANDDVVATGPDATSAWTTDEVGIGTVRYDPADAASGKLVKEAVERGAQVIPEFFGRDFPQPFEVVVFPDRASLTNHWREAWQMPEFEPACWMVASGEARRLAILSPSRWKTEACEHDSDNLERTRLLIVHELVHVFHAQVGPRPDFAGMDGIGWFVEGLAAHASGQLDAGYLLSSREAIDAGAAPTELKKAWSGKYRYGVSGSLVRFVDERLGRKALLQLVQTATDEESILSSLGLSEKELLEAWAAAVPE